jgi:hypothetical protein
LEKEGILADVIWKCKKRRKDGVQKVKSKGIKIKDKGKVIIKLR